MSGRYATVVCVLQHYSYQASMFLLPATRWAWGGTGEKLAGKKEDEDTMDITSISLSAPENVNPCMYHALFPVAGSRYRVITTACSEAIYPQCRPCRQSVGVRQSIWKGFSAACFALSASRTASPFIPIPGVLLWHTMSVCGSSRWTSHHGRSLPSSCAEMMDSNPQEASNSTARDR